MLYRVHLVWAGFELKTLVVIGTYCIDKTKNKVENKIKKIGTIYVDFW